jgi:uncharacterized membrane protein YedE/YeeE
MRALIALAAGALFGAGLALSGMADPARVRAFLDLFGAWDPTLAFVMGGAILPMALAWRIRPRMDRPLADEAFGRLAIGAILFGAGWGLGGLCPGPAIASLVLYPLSVAPFLLAMGAGFALHRFTIR